MSEPKEQLVSRAEGCRRAGQGRNRACHGRRGSGRSLGRHRGQAGCSGGSFTRMSCCHQEAEGQTHPVIFGKRPDRSEGRGA